MSTIVRLPIRGSKSAPTFTHAHTQEIHCYFESVEFLLKQAQITSTREWIDAIVFYADFETSDFWQSLPPFSAQPPHYAAFKDAVLALYPEADSTQNKFTIADLQQLIFDTHHTGIHDINSLGQYYRRFLHISNFLISKSRLSDIDTHRLFVTGFPDQLQEKILARLQVKFPDSHHDDPWPIDRVYDTACFILRYSANSVPSPSPSPALPHPPHRIPSSQPSSSLGIVPVNDITTLVSALTQELTKSIHEVIQQSRPQVRSRSSPSSRRSCHFCGSFSHFIGKCDAVIDYIRNGKCQRNQYGKVVLPSGAFVPSSIPGSILKEKIDEYHRLNPNQVAAPQFSVKLLKAEFFPLFYSEARQYSTV